MSDTEQSQSTHRRPGPAHETPPGILITRVRGYNLFNTVFFGGRRRRLDTALAAESGASRGDHVLDIGCGPGRFAGALAERVGPTGQVEGVDASGPMIDYASAHAGRTGNCTFHLGTAQSLSLPDASFDVVTSTFVMHHIPEDQREVALGHMFRVLRPGGRLLIADMHPLDRLRAGAVRALARVATHRPGHGHGHGHGHGADGETPTDPFAAVDVRRYIDSLHHIGFTGVEFRPVKPSTGCLVAVRPDGLRRSS